ncbi:MAG TPA: hypothetical protein VN256_21605 [Pyrinomonadaceae bacterium]|nr:hypothetical protein [Pyrinomonadaceae bacterium]
MNSIRCSNCSLLNFETATACKRCGLPFNSEAEAVSDAQQYAPPPESYPPTPPAEGHSYYWDQPNYQPNFIPPPQPSSSSSGATKLVGVLVSVAVAALVAFVAMPWLLKSGKATNFSNVTWSEYKSPDGSFSVTLPGKPQEINMNQPTEAGTAKVRVAAAQISPAAGCMVMSAEYPIVGKYSEEELFERALQSMANAEASSMGLTAKKLISQDGHRGIEVEFNSPMLERVGAKARARMFFVPPKLYMVMSAGPETPEFKSVGDKCLDTFKFSN